MILNENYSILVEFFCRPYFWRYSCMSAIALRKPYFWRHSCVSAIALWISDTLSCWQKCRILLIFIHFCRWGNICRQILPTQVCIVESVVFPMDNISCRRKSFPTYQRRQLADTMICIGKTYTMLYDFSRRVYVYRRNMIFVVVRTSATTKKRYGERERLLV